MEIRVAGDELESVVLTMAEVDGGGIIVSLARSREGEVGFGLSRRD
jgi:hypothetical protein